MSMQNVARRAAAVEPVRRAAAAEPPLTRAKMVEKALLDARAHGSATVKRNTVGDMPLCADLAAWYASPLQDRSVYFSVSLMYRMLSSLEDQQRLLQGVTRMVFLNGEDMPLNGQLAASSDSTGGTPFLGGCNQIFPTMSARVNVSSDTLVLPGARVPVPVASTELPDAPAFDGAVPASGLPAGIRLPTGIALPAGTALPAAVLGVITVPAGTTGLFVPTGSLPFPDGSLPANTYAVAVTGGTLYVRADGSAFPATIDLGSTTATTPVGATSLVVPIGTEICPPTPLAVPAIAWIGRPAQRALMAYLRSHMVVVKQCGVIRAEVPLCDMVRFDCGVTFEGASSSMGPGVYWEHELNEEILAAGFETQILLQNTDGTGALPPVLAPETYGAPSANCPGYYNFAQPLVGTADKPVSISIEVRQECVGDLEELARWIANNPDELTKGSDLFGELVCGIDARNGAAIIKVGFFCITIEFFGVQLTDDSLCDCWNTTLSKSPKPVCEALMQPIISHCSGIPAERFVRPAWKVQQDEKAAREAGTRG